MHRAHVVVLAGLPEALVGDLEDRVGVDGVAQRLVHALVVERFDGLHAGRGRVRGGHLVHLHVRQLLQRVELGDVGAVEPVDLLRGERGDRRRRIVTEVDELDLVEIRPAAPVGLLARLEHLTAPNLGLDQGEGAGAVGAHLELAVLGRVEDQQRIVKELLRHGELRGLAVELHRERIDFLNGVGVPELRGLLGVALVVLLAGLVFLEQEALHEAEHRGAGLGIEHPLEVPDDVVGRELPAVVPLDVAAQPQGPRLQVRARLPLLDERGPRDVVDTGGRQIVEDLARGVRRFDPAVGVRALEVLAPHADAEHAALRQGLRRGRRDERLAGHLAHEGIGGRRRHAQQHRVAHELSPVDQAIGELALEGGDQDVLVSVARGGSLRRPAGRRQCRWVPRSCQPRWTTGLDLREAAVAGRFGLPLALEHHVERRAVRGNEARDQQLVERRLQLRRRVRGQERLGQPPARRGVDAG